jgi:hypothetical protein
VGEIPATGAGTTFRFRDHTCEKGEVLTQSICLFAFLSVEDTSQICSFTFARHSEILSVSHSSQSHGIVTKVPTPLEGLCFVKSQSNICALSCVDLDADNNCSISSHG